jgi:hypothetical protein
MNTKEFDIITLVESHPKMNKFDYSPPKTSDCFSIQQHINYLIAAFLSNQRPWNGIEKNWQKISTIFYQFDPQAIIEKINTAGYEFFVDELRKISCGNRSIKFQMKNLERNIRLLIKFEIENGSIDKYYRKFSTKDLVKNLSDNRSENKIVGMGVALVCEYLKNVGIDVAKPDVHIRRILGSERLGYSRNKDAEIDEVFDIIDLFCNNTGKSRAYIDVLLWNYCADNYGEICTAKPNCQNCSIIKYCNYNSITKASTKNELSCKLGRYDTLTKYIDEIASTSCFGEESKSHHGYVLADVVERFKRDFLDFSFGRSIDGKEKNPGFDYFNYDEIISNAAKICGCEEKDIKRGRVLYDAQTTLAAILWINRSEHWGGGLGSEWYEAFSEGRILKWLQHLKALDNG